MLHRLTPVCFRQSGGDKLVSRHESPAKARGVAAYVGHALYAFADSESRPISRRTRLFRPKASRLSASYLSG
jgi:hypothetical protein